MIRVEKGACPPKLAARSVEDTKRYRAAPPEKKPSSWNTDEVKAAVRAECRDKCIYCEVLPDDASYGAIEHIRPRKDFPELVLDWLNLGLACTRCNTNKSEYWTSAEALQLINPYVDEPSEHIIFSGPTAVARLESSRGANTIRQLKLNRDQLFLARGRRQQDLDLRITQWHVESDEDIKDVLAQDIHDMLEDTSEFAAALRAFALWRGFPG